MAIRESQKAGTAQSDGSHKPLISAEFPQFLNAGHGVHPHKLTLRKLQCAGERWEVCKLTVNVFYGIYKLLLLFLS